jgi:pre-mRNA-splicing factor CWC22
MMTVYLIVHAGGDGKMQIKDMTQTNLVTLRRTIYLTIMSSLDFEECAHKLLKMTAQPGLEVYIDLYIP